jgi:glycosyltransferase involved in cell wall biosynthesis
MNRFQRPIAAFIVCKNEVAVLGDCLDSLDFCREVVIVDSGSTDGTLDLIEGYRKRGFPIRLIKRDWPGYAKQKQFALEQCRQPWCLSLDSDERLDSDLKATLSTMPLDDASPSRFAFLLRDYLPGYGYPPAAVHAKPIVRLVKKGAARFDETALVHESLTGEGPVATIRPGALLHSRNMSIKREAEKVSFYADLKARDQFSRGRRTNLFKIMFKPIGRFVASYLGQRYFLCGMPGLIYSAMFAQYSFLTEAMLYRLSLGEETPEEKQRDRP